MHESKLAAAVDANIVKSMYPMFANFIEFFINRRTNKYKFKFEFHDVDIPDDKEYRKATVKEFAQIGIVDFQDVARVFDMNAFQLKRRLQMSKSMGIDKEITDLLIPNLQDETEEIFMGKRSYGRAVSAEVMTPAFCAVPSPPVGTPLSMILE